MDMSETFTQKYDTIIIYYVKISDIAIAYQHSKSWFAKLIKLDVCGSLVFSKPVTNNAGIIGRFLSSSISKFNN